MTSARSEAGACDSTCGHEEVVMIACLSLPLQPLYMGVVGLCEETEFTVCLHREDTLAAAQGTWARERESEGLLSGLRSK